MRTPLAILISDLHFSNAPPVARAGEPSWFDAMGRPLRWLTELQDVYGGVPIIAAGDIWDRWTQPPGVINYIIDNCPQFYAIPGQHDLAGHLYENRDHGAYGTLRRAGVLLDLDAEEWTRLSDHFYVHAFPWGADMSVSIKPRRGVVCLAVCHRYIHNGGHTAYMHATEDQAAGNLQGLEGFTACHFGDNHIPFEYRTKDGRLIINTGGFYRRSADQVQHKPGAVVLWRDDMAVGGVTHTREVYDTADEVFSRDHLALAEVSYAAALGNVDAFIARMLDNASPVTDFRDYVRQFAKQPDVSPMVSDLLCRAVE